MSTPPKTHQLDLGRAGFAAVRITFAPDEITAAIDLPKGLNRRDRRHVQRWTAGIFRELDPDPRGIRIVATCNGRVMVIGGDINGKGAALFL